VQTKILGKTFFSIVTIAACYFSEVFWEGTAYQVLLPLVLLAVWFDWWIIARFNLQESDKSKNLRSSNKKR
jgi:hypothetical protein